MRTPKLNYEAPRTDEIRFRPELNFCTSSTDVDMTENIFDDLDIITLPSIW